MLEMRKSNDDLRKMKNAHRAIFDFVSDFLLIEWKISLRRIIVQKKRILDASISNVTFQMSQKFRS